MHGEFSCTMNAQLLVHMPYFVHLWGPLWSAFSFESHNGHLVKMIHSTHKVAEQLSFSLNVKLSVARREGFRRPVNSS